MLNIFIKPWFWMACGDGCWLDCYYRPGRGNPSYRRLSPARSPRYRPSVPGGYGGTPPGTRIHMVATRTCSPWHTWRLVDAEPPRRRTPNPDTKRQRGWQGFRSSPFKGKKMIQGLNHTLTLLTFSFISLCYLTGIYKTIKWNVCYCNAHVYSLNLF